MILKYFIKFDFIYFSLFSIYSDFFDGTTSARLVYPFFVELASHKLVNQLGTGTLHCKGFQMPSFYFMETSSPEDVLHTVINLVTHRLPTKLGYSPLTDIQILTPMTRGVVGTKNLNIEFRF